MEHYNPILGSETSGQKFITCGEIMLRLTPPNYEKLRMASNFEASYGGSEANIALALANLGVDSTFFSVVPNNSLGKSAVRWLRSNDVHCTPMILTEPDETPSNRLGTYYLETGYGIRASKVIYDRKHSVITEYDFSQVDLDALLDGFDWLHLSGITPALAPNCRGLIIDMLKTAKKKGLTVSFDGNFRSTLWSWEEARDFCTECLPYVDVLLGIELPRRQGQEGCGRQELRPDAGHHRGSRCAAGVRRHRQECPRDRWQEAVRHRELPCLRAEEPHGLMRFL